MLTSAPTLSGRRIAALTASVAALLLSSTGLFAQAGGGQSGLSADTPVIARQPAGPGGGGGAAAPGASTVPDPAATAGSVTPLPPRDGPRTASPPRDAARARQPGQRAAAAVDPDWPCVQVKVSSMSYGQMWAGPPLDDAFKTWRADADLADLVEEITARRTRMADAKAEIAKFAEQARDKADARLTMLFAGVFDTLNDQRSQLMSGIERYSRKQRELSERIKTESLEMASAQRDMAAQNSPEAQKQAEALNWDTRIYEERAQSLAYVCESPVILEQRAFDLGREIQARLTQSSQ